MMSRRQFIKTSVGATGIVLGSGLLIPGLALANGADPKPIPIGIQPFGPGTQLFHVILPAPGIEPSTITDFHGSIGLAHVQGTGTGTNTNTGHQRHLLFDVDARFMQGVYIGMDGQQHTGTFALIWLDLYKEQVVPPNQIHDFNPGIAPSGLFWTIRVPDNSVEVDLDDATASLTLSDVEIEDYFNLVNALKDGHNVPANVSLQVRWSGVQKRVHERDKKSGFVGNFIENTATIEWSGREKDFTFVSDLADTSTNVFAEIGHERNGVFFPDDDEDGDTD